MGNNFIFDTDDGFCQGRLNCSDGEECKRYATLGEPREMCECRPGTTRAFRYQGIRIVHALEFDEEEMRPPCVDPSQIGSYTEYNKIQESLSRLNNRSRNSVGIEGVKTREVHLAAFGCKSHLLTYC